MEIVAFLRFEDDGKISEGKLWDDSFFKNLKKVLRPFFKRTHLGFLHGELRELSLDEELALVTKGPFQRDVLHQQLKLMTSWDQADLQSQVKHALAKGVVACHIDVFTAGVRKELIERLVI